MVKKQKNVLYGNRQSHYIHKTFYIFDDILKILQKMLKHGLTLQIMS